MSKAVGEQTDVPVSGPETRGFYFISDEYTTAESEGKLQGALGSREHVFKVLFTRALVPLPQKMVHSFHQAFE